MSIKTRLVVSLSVLLVIEVLFSPIIGTVSSIVSKSEYVLISSILFNSDVDISYLNIALFLEIISSFYVGLTLFKTSRKSKNLVKNLSGGALFLISLVAFASLVFVNAFSNIGF